MGFLKKIFGFGKKEEEKVDEGVIEEPIEDLTFEYIKKLIDEL